MHDKNLQSPARVFIFIKYVSDDCDMSGDAAERIVGDVLRVDVGLSVCTRMNKT